LDVYQKLGLVWLKNQFLVLTLASRQRDASVTLASWQDTH
jgi:hypothetical protein